MKKLLRRSILLIMLISIVCVSLKSCTVILTNILYQDLGNRNWRIVLGQGYELNQINGKEILLTKDGWSERTNIVIPSSVSAFCHNGNYIGIESLDDFYVINMDKNLLYGPFSNDQYISFCTNNEISGLSIWTQTSPRPDNAVYS